MRSIVRVVALASLLSAMATEAAADVRIVWQRVSGGEGATAVRMIETIAGTKQREDEIRSGEAPTFTIIRDVEGLAEELLWHDFKLRETQPLEPMKPKNTPQDAAVTARIRSARGTPTGRTATIAGVECREFSFAARSYDKKFSVKGSYWRPARRDGNAEYAALYGQLIMLGLPPEKGHVSKGNRGKMRGRLELQREFLAAARREGIPYRYEYEVSGSGIAPLKEKREVLRVEVTPAPADAFTVPAGYRPR